jgi:tRNA 2-thiocytidine biosynthesis protein TtcA
MAYCKEKDIKAYSAEMNFPIIPCNLCGSQPNLQRRAMKEMLAVWDKQFPGRVDNMLRSLSNVVPSHLLDRKLHGFGTARISSHDGDMSNWLASSPDGDDRTHIDRSAHIRIELADS